MNFINKNREKIIIALIVIIIVLLPACIYYKFINTPASSQNKNIEIRITEGMNSSKILNKLSEEGLIKGKIFAKLYMKTNSIGNNLKAGVYKFNLNMTPKQIFDMLKNHKIDLNFVNFVIPEGYTIDQIANKLHKLGLINNKDEFFNSIQKDEFKYSFIKNIGPNRTYRLEGYLFPDTYEFEKGMTVHFMINEMLGRFNLVYNELKDEIDNSTIPLDKAIIMASMIEGEAKIDSERPIIAAVINNRLRVKMNLQIDATVQYALGVHKSVLHLKDLRVKSLYNTYNNKGLPIGPICSPGKKSIEAALNPVKANYIYYIARGDGSHFFTNSYKKFLAFKHSLKK